MDRPWWDKYHQEVADVFAGERYAAADSCYGAKKLKGHHYGNSGAGAMSLAARMGAKKIIMLGYDCGYSDGKRHWHGSHPEGLGNAGSVGTWPKQFSQLADFLRMNGVQVINCSRVTRLTCFERADLAAVLQ